MTEDSGKGRRPVGASEECEAPREEAGYVALSAKDGTLVANSVLCLSEPSTARVMTLEEVQQVPKATATKGSGKVRNSAGVHSGSAECEILLKAAGQVTQ